MAEGIMNSDGSRNWQANILLDNVKRLEQENFALTQESQQKSQTICELEQENKELKEENKQHIKEKQILHERLYCYAYEKDCHLVCKQQNCLLKNSYAYRSALEEIREKAQHCIKQDVCALCDYSKECAVPDADGLVYDNNRLLIKLINECIGEQQ